MKLCIGLILLPILVVALKSKEDIQNDIIDKLQQKLKICRKNITAETKNLKKCNKDLKLCHVNTNLHITLLENLIKECKVNETFLEDEINTLTVKLSPIINLCNVYTGGLLYKTPRPGGSFYHFHTKPYDVMMSQSDANAFCLKYGMKLVTINDAAENTWLQNIITSIFTEAGLTGDATTYFRTNLKLQSDGTTWGWGSSGTAASFTDWKSGAVTYPDDATNNPCGNMRWQDNEVKWTNDDCTTPARFICEIADPCA